MSAQEPPFDYSFPYTSQRMPVFAQNCVATSHPLAAQAGLDMMRKGGNAIDAAVATAISLTVLEPTSNGIGSDCFALVWVGGGLHGLNPSGRAPMALDRSRWAGKDKIPTGGWDGVTTPGAVSGLGRALQEFRRAPIRRSLRARDPIRARRCAHARPDRVLLGRIRQTVFP